MKRIWILTAMAPLLATCWHFDVRGQVPAPQGGAPAAAESEQIDFDKARQLLERQRRGERLSSDEAAYLERARAARRSAGGGAPATSTQRTGQSSTGMKPLTEMTADDRYKGQDGGLYGGGLNQPPSQHLEAALAAARAVKPLDAQGKPASNGKVVLVSVGMSNTTQEFSQFVRLARADSAVARPLVIVDGAQGGQDSAAWARRPDQRARGDRPSPWDTLEQRLRSAGVTAAQVQVVWLKQARIAPGSIGEFPRHADVLRDDILTILQTLKARFPNLQLAYLSSRIYAGHASGALNPEPYAYESAYAVRSLIQRQIAADPQLNYDGRRGLVRAPVVLWGPYLWGDGDRPREADGLVWLREDLAGDGTHPSDSGRAKVARLLLDFFKTDPTARPWFSAEPS